MLQSRSSAAPACEPQHPAVRQEYSLAKGMSQCDVDIEEQRHILTHAGASNLHRWRSSTERIDVPRTRVAHGGLLIYHAVLRCLMLVVRRRRFPA